MGIGIITHFHQLALSGKLTTSDAQNLAKNALESAVFMDIDWFKKINDTYGHSCGDHVLNEMAKCMQTNIRPDDYCMRYGGEEFLVIGLYKDQQTIINVAERIRQKASDIVFQHSGSDFHVTLSAGIAIYRSGEETFKDTLKRADEKLYQSKANGRNCVSI